MRNNARYLWLISGRFRSFDTARRATLFTVPKLLNSDQLLGSADFSWVDGWKTSVMFTLKNEAGVPLKQRNFFTQWDGEKIFFRRTISRRVSSPPLLYETGADKNRWSSNFGANYASERYISALSFNKRNIAKKKQSLFVGMHDTCILKMLTNMPTWKFCLVDAGKRLTSPWYIRAFRASHRRFQYASVQYR